MDNDLKRQILDIINYGVEWIDCCYINDDYSAGSCETLGYIIASLLSNKTDLFPNGLDSLWVVSALKLKEYLPESNRAQLLDQLCK
jgi:hypothetical protein